MTSTPPPRSAASTSPHVTLPRVRVFEWRRWLPEAMVALAVAVISLLLTSANLVLEYRWSLVVAVLCAAVLFCRHRPGVALALLWVDAALKESFMLQLDERSHGYDSVWSAVAEDARADVFGGLPVYIVVLAAVFFGVGRWGGRATVVLGGVTAMLPVVLHLALGGRTEAVGNMLLDAPVVGLLPLAAGMVVRFAARASASDAEAATAKTTLAETEEIARLKAAQARLATDVHDVVGHSLAVILAQAEAGQYADDDAALKQRLATIAGSARGSLREVRAVLEGTAPAGPGVLDELVERVGSGGREIVSTETGTPRPLPPELATVAYRSLQEMLTNALRHGAADQPVHVGRHWPDEAAGVLRIEVRNMVTTDAATEAEGRGLTGMRRRLQAVGGRVDVRLDQGEFTVTASVPVRSAETEASA